jgi:hypothetical protein
MANEQWYVLKVRSGFVHIVIQRLRKLNFEVLVPERKNIASQEPQSASDYVYCRFCLGNRDAVTGIPGVLDILGTPEPTPLSGDWPVLQSVTRFRL